MTTATSENSLRDTESASNVQPESTTPKSTYLLPTLQKAFQRSLSATLSKCSYAAFSTCYPTPAAKKPDTLKTVWKQINSKIDVKAGAEFQAVVRERDLDARFAELEQVLARAKVRKNEQGENQNGQEQSNDDQANTKDQALQPDPASNSSIHALAPEDLFRATLAPDLAPLSAQLQNRIDTQRDTNEVLIQDLLRKRQEIESIVSALEDVVRDMQGANAVLYAAGKDLDDAGGQG